MPKFNHMLPVCSRQRHSTSFSLQLKRCLVSALHFPLTRSGHRHLSLFPDILQYLVSRRDDLKASKTLRSWQRCCNRPSDCHRRKLQTLAPRLLLARDRQIHDRPHQTDGLPHCVGGPHHLAPHYHTETGHFPAMWTGLVLSSASDSSTNDSGTMSQSLQRSSPPPTSRLLLRPSTSVSSPCDRVVPTSHQPDYALSRPRLAPIRSRKSTREWRGRR